MEDSKDVVCQSASRSIYLKFERVLTMGSFSQYLQAQDEAGGKFIVKAILKKYNLTDQEKEKLLMEWYCFDCNQICPQILKGFQAFQTMNYMCMVLEHANGCVLETYLQTLPEQRMTEEAAKSITVQVIEALDFLHTHSIVYRGLCAANILICSNSSIKIFDFRDATKLVEANPSLAEPAGAPAYMSPECANAKECAVDIATDYWSLGVLLYVMLYGTEPFAYDKDVAVFLKNMEELEVVTNVCTEFAEDVLKKLLMIEVDARITKPSAMSAHPWFYNWVGLLNSALPITIPEEPEREFPQHLKVFDPVSRCADPMYNMMSEEFPHITVNSGEYGCMKSVSNRFKSTLSLWTPAAAEADEYGKTVSLKLQHRKASSSQLQRTGSSGSLLENILTPGSRLTDSRGKLRVIVVNRLLSGRNFNIYEVHHTVKRTKSIRIMKTFSKENLKIATTELQVYSALRHCSLFPTLIAAYQNNDLLCLVFEKFTYFKTLSTVIKEANKLKNDTLKNIKIVLAESSEASRVTSLKANLESRWAIVIYKMLQALYELQTLGIRHNNFTASQIHVDVTNASIRISGFSQANFGEPETACEEDKAAFANIMAAIFLLDEDASSSEVPAYVGRQLSLLFKHIRAPGKLSWHLISGNGLFTNAFSNEKQKEEQSGLPQMLIEGAQAATFDVCTIVSPVFAKRKSTLGQPPKP